MDFDIMELLIPVKLMTLSLSSRTRTPNPNHTHLAEYKLELLKVQVLTIVALDHLEPPRIASAL